jgi:hypothetical protein
MNPLSIIRVLLPLEAATFVTAAAIHFGAFLPGYDHTKAGIAESVIATVLLSGSVLAWNGPERALKAAVGTQGFAIFGVSVGLLTITIGVGPRTVLDVVYHVSIVVVLVAGLALASGELGRGRGARLTSS